MERQEFIEQIERLMQTYGRAKYPDERVNIFWAKFQHISISDFKRVISMLIAKELYAPMYDKIIESLSLNNSYNTKKNSTEAIKQRQSCKKCANEGAYTSVTNGLSFRWRCTCQLGDFLYPNYPQENIYE